MTLVPSEAPNRLPFPPIVDFRRAILLSLHCKTVEKLARSHAKPGVRPGNAWRFSRNSLIRACAGLRRVMDEATSLHISKSGYP